MIRVTRSIAIDDSEITFEFIRSSGPGGQNVNKVATAVRLRFDARRSVSLPADVRERLIRLAGKRAGEDGVLMILARRRRTQEANRRDAVERLVALTARAAERPRSRRATRPTTASRERRLDAKRLRAGKKAARHAIRHADE
ncbi:MAG: alternative ribosome rescue aminoacyl-tRNA hydrolase ArfB [Candidatus Krumholzibacteriaceae bacterium]|jgi:ribosome-associated protein